MRSVILMATLCLGACAPPPAERPDSLPSPHASAADSLTGVVRVVGSAPMNVRVVLSGDGGSTVLEGTLLPELRGLAGAEVVVMGRRSPAGFAVEDYRIRTVDGRPVLQGTVEGRSGPYLLLRTRDGALVHLLSAPESFSVGQRVWIQGPEARIVQSYGTLGR